MAEDICNHAAREIPKIRVFLTSLSDQCLKQAPADGVASISCSGLSLGVIQPPPEAVATNAWSLPRVVIIRLPSSSRILSPLHVEVVWMMLPQTRKFRCVSHLRGISLGITGKLESNFVTFCRKLHMWPT